MKIRTVIRATIALAGLASLGACAGLFVQGFCAARGIPYDEIRIVQRAEIGPDKVLAAVELEVQLPTSFPEKYRDAVLKVAEQCSVKKAIAAKPTVRVRAAPPATATPASMG